MSNDISFEDFSNVLERAEKRLTENIENTIKLCCEKVRSDIQESMAHTKRDMSKTYYTNNKTKAHHPSMPGNPPAPDSGDLRRSIRYEIHKTENEVIGIVGSTQKDPDYAVWMEYGTKDGRIAHRPWLRPAMMNNNDFIRSTLTAAVKKNFEGARS